MGILKKLFGKGNHPPESASKLGRNNPCWCGSGKKYKKCHYNSDKAYFSRALASSCKTPT